MEEKVVRKKAVGKTVRRSPVRKAATSSSVPRKAVSPATAVARKAPTRTAVAETTTASQTKRKRGGKALFVGLFLFATLLGVSALIGYSDKGQLDVSGAIAQRKQNASEEEKRALDNVPTEQGQPTVPNGGLVGMGAPEPVTEPNPVATSTDEMASSTLENPGVEGSDAAPSANTPSENTEDTESSDPQAVEVANAETAEA